MDPKFISNPIDAAVLVLCHKKNGENYLLLTKRSENVAHHKGQICFPGGVKDKNDPTLWDTALRETWEEIGLPKEHVSFRRELSVITTPTGFRVTPFVGSITNLHDLNPSPIEIAEVFWVPMNHLLDAKNFSLEKKIYFGITYDDPTYIYKDYKIWGATGRIMRDFLSVETGIGVDFAKG